MRRVLCETLPSPGRSRELSDDEGSHLVRVLRMRDGDFVEALDGKGGTRMCRIRVRGKKILVEADESAASANAPHAQAAAGPAQVLPIELEMAILKGDAMEWVIEKAVELGVRRLVPLTTAHTVVQVDKKGPGAFRERWQKIADQALKQCGRLERMEVELPTTLEERLRGAASSAKTPRFWADEGREPGTPELAQAIDSAEGGLETVMLLIGPEGGWSLKERDLIPTAATPVSLGPLVLRAETAALFSASIASAKLRNKT